MCRWPLPGKSPTFTQGLMVEPLQRDQYLSHMIASFTTSWKNTIPGFYDKVVELSEEHRNQINKAPFSLTDYKGHLNIREVHGEAGYSTIERIGVRPTLDVNGIWGGYSGEGAKTVLPSKRMLKFPCDWCLISPVKK